MTITIPTPSVSKTSLNGVVALLIVVGTALLASGSPIIGHTATLDITLALGVLRAITGFLQKDADRVTAIVPGSPEPVAVAAHPVPDDPKAIAKP